MHQLRFHWMKAVRSALAVGLLALSFSVLAEEPIAIEFTDFDCAEGPPFAARLSWDFERSGADRIEIRMGAADGRLFRVVESGGSATTGRWVRPDTRFFFVDRDSGAVVHELEAGLPPECEVSRAPIEPDQIEFTTVPPRMRVCGKPIERTQVTLKWDVSALGEQPVRITLNSPDGRSFVSGGAVGEAETGKWVTDGMRFVLHLPMREEAVAEYVFRILSCKVSDDPEEPPLRILNR